MSDSLNGSTSDYFANFLCFLTDYSAFFGFRGMIGIAFYGRSETLRVLIIQQPPTCPQPLNRCSPAR